MSPSEYAEGLRHAADLIETNEIEPEDIAYISDEHDEVIIQMLDIAAFNRNSDLDDLIQLRTHQSPDPALA